MARIRSVHDGLFTDERFASVSPLARLLFVGIGNLAYDDGVFNWAPIAFKMKILPADNCDIVALLSELEAVDLVRRHTIAGREVGTIRNFVVWQRPKSPNSSGVMTAEMREHVGFSHPKFRSRGASDSSISEIGHVERHQISEIEESDGGCISEIEATDVGSASEIEAANQTSKEKSKRRGEERRGEEGKGEEGKGEIHTPPLPPSQARGEYECNSVTGKLAERPRRLTAYERKKAEDLEKVRALDRKMAEDLAKADAARNARKDARLAEADARRDPPPPAEPVEPLAAIAPGGSA